MVAQNDHYEGGEPGYAHLTVRNSSSADMGRYTCVLENSVGASDVQDFIDVSVLCRYPRRIVSYRYPPSLRHPPSSVFLPFSRSSSRRPGGKLYIFRINHPVR